MNVLHMKAVVTIGGSLILSIASPALAGLFDAETKIIANDAETGDRFGESVAISGNTAIVGAKGNDDSGDRSGSAYLFDVTTGRHGPHLLTKLSGIEEWQMQST